MSKTNLLLKIRQKKHLSAEEKQNEYQASLKTMKCVACEANVGNSFKISSIVKSNNLSDKDVTRQFFARCGHPDNQPKCDFNIMFNVEPTDRIKDIIREFKDEVKESKKEIMKLKLEHLFGYSDMLFKDRFEELKTNIDESIEVIKMLEHDEESAIEKHLDIEKVNAIKSQISQIKKILKESISYSKEEHSRKRDDISKRITELFTLYSELKKMLLIYREVEVEDEKQEEDHESNIAIVKKPPIIRLKSYDRIDADYLSKPTDENGDSIVSFTGIDY